MKRGRSKVAVLGRTRTAAKAQTISRLLAPSRVLVPTPREVAAYLKGYPQLGRLLPEFCMRVRKTLGPDVELSLEIYSDPEIDDRYLTLYARQPTYDPGLLRRIEALRQQTNPQLERVPGYLLLMTDFRRPGTQYAV
jgi:hypothetical protein